MVFVAVRGILRAMAEDDEEELVRKARDGDRRAFDRLVALHLPQVWATVWRVLRHRQDAEDVVQEVFVTAYRSLSGFPRRVEAFDLAPPHRRDACLNHLESRRRSAAGCRIPSTVKPRAARSRSERRSPRSRRKR
mgnify:CR=1 FL=1